MNVRSMLLVVVVVRLEEGANCCDDDIRSDVRSGSGYESNVLVEVVDDVDLVQGVGPSLPDAVCCCFQPRAFGGREEVYVGRGGDPREMRGFVVRFKVGSIGSHGESEVGQSEEHATHDSHFGIAMRAVELKAAYCRMRFDRIDDDTGNRCGVEVVGEDGTCCLSQIIHRLKAL